MVEHGFETEDGRTAIRRVNQMHQRYDISNDDMRYVLCTFVVVPKRWIDRYGWRRLSEHELRAGAAYYQALGRRMGIKEIPSGYREFEEFLDAYEEAHFGWDAGARQVSDATLDLMASWYPRPLAGVVRAASMALLDDSLLRAFRYEQPGSPAPWCRAPCGCAPAPCACCRPRRTPHYARQNPEIKGYPNGFRLADLGTFPAPGCPVQHETDLSSIHFQPRRLTAPESIHCMKPPPFVQIHPFNTSTVI